MYLLKTVFEMFIKLLHDISTNLKISRTERFDVDLTEKFTSVRFKGLRILLLFLKLENIQKRLH